MREGERDCVCVCERERGRKSETLLPVSHQLGSPLSLILEEARDATWECREMSISSPNNQRQTRISHSPKDVLPLRA